MKVYNIYFAIAIAIQFCADFPVFSNSTLKNKVNYLPTPSLRHYTITKVGQVGRYTGLEFGNKKTFLYTKHNTYGTFLNLTVECVPFEHLNGGKQCCFAPWRSFVRSFWSKNRVAFRVFVLTNNACVLLL